MACGAGIKDGDLHAVVFDDIEHTAYKISCINCNSFTGFKINLYAPFFLCIINALFKPCDIVIRFCYVMAAAHVEPLHPRKNITELLFDSFQRDLKSIRTLLAKSMKMKTVKKFQNLSGHLFVPYASGNTEAAALCAGIVDLMTFLRGAFRVDAKTDALSAIFCFTAESLQLINGIKDYVVCVV